MGTGWARKRRSDEGSEGLCKDHDAGADCEGVGGGGAEGGGEGGGEGGEDERGGRKGEWKGVRILGQRQLLDAIQRWDGAHGGVDRL